GIQFALRLFLDPCLEQTMRRFKNASVKFSPSLSDRLSGLNLPYPSPQMSEAGFEDLLFGFVTSPRLPSRLRIVENFQTRDNRGAALNQQTVLASAHRFTALVPEGLTPEESAMVERILNLEKPAHTRFDVRRYFEFFRVGEARLGLDTVIGE